MTYVTMFMPFLYNIIYCNNTVVIQCSVYMYTENFHSIISFRITEGADKTCVIWYKTCFIWPLSFCGFNECQQLPCIMSFNTGHVCDSLSETPVQLGYITHFRIDAMTKICSKLYVTLHCYIVKVWQIHIYIYLHLIKISILYI